MFSMSDMPTDISGMHGVCVRLACVYYAGIIFSIIGTGKRKAICQHNG